MIKLLISALLLSAGIAVAQTPSKSTSGAAKSATNSKTASSSATKPSSGSVARSTKPIPKPSQKDNMESKDNAIPSYKQAKDAGKSRASYNYKPRRNASGARLDTMPKKN
ncbi:hypothetical protein GCM10028806_44500 [Spirosoma terrae]|uniref:Uncharacterized protein n=1 Tax=Spirosoma terrae TaxID=1968276 RepID=A0A6L9L338_9BACT|nr:hypothetical protein [Spirosoma terrae]NDU93882.1 hypothetical protein [Spirosoma terrae]